MLKISDSNGGTIVLEVEGRLDREEIEQVTQLVEQSLAEYDKTHIYLEITAFNGFDLAALPEYLPRAGRMLGQLHRFGRIAVVAGQGWVRWWTRLESAILPGIRYELFLPEEKKQALDWVEGRTVRPHAASMKIIETDKAQVFGFEIDGRMTKLEFDAVADEFMDRFERLDSVGLLGRIRRLDGFEPAALFNGAYLQMKMKALTKVDRYALVGGPAWLNHWVQWLDPLVKADLRHFEADEERLAWAWLGAEPKSERALAA